MNSAKKHEEYRTFGGYKSFNDRDVARRIYWQSRTPGERMEALESLRIAVYGEATINAKIPRLFGVSVSCQSKRMI